MEWEGGAYLASVCEHQGDAGMDSCPFLFQHLYGLILRQNLEPKSLWIIYWQYQITDLVYTVDAVILIESSEALVMGLETLHDVAKLVRLQVSQPKTEV